MSPDRLASNGWEGDWEFRDARGRAKPLGSLGALDPQVDVVVRASQVPVPDEDDDLSEEPTEDQLRWACDQLDDELVAHVRAKLAKVPWLGKPCSGEPKPKSPQSSDNDSDGSVGTVDALTFFGGPPLQV